MLNTFYYQLKHTCVRQLVIKSVQHMRCLWESECSNVVITHVLWCSVLPYLLIKSHKWILFYQTNAVRTFHPVYLRLIAILSSYLWLHFARGLCSHCSPERVCFCVYMSADAILNTRVRNCQLPDVRRTRCVLVIIGVAYNCDAIALGHIATQRHPVAVNYQKRYHRGYEK